MISQVTVFRVSRLTPDPISRPSQYRFSYERTNLRTNEDPSNPLEKSLTFGNARGGAL